MISKLLTVTLALVVGAHSAFAQVKDEAGFEAQSKPPQQSRDSPQRQEPGSANRGYASVKYQVFNFVFSDWNPDSLHWNQPSNLTFQSDGSWYIYAKHIANMRRLGGVIDSGARYTALANVTFFDGPLNAQKQCTGSVVHSQDYTLGTLNYKQETWDASNRDTDSTLASVIARVKCASATRWWR